MRNVIFANLQYATDFYFLSFDLHFLSHDLHFLSGVSHVIVDEVHERDVNSDFLLILLREIVRAGQGTKVILMSASVDAQLYIKYFTDRRAGSVWAWLVGGGVACITVCVAVGVALPNPTHSPNTPSHPHTLTPSQYSRGSLCECGGSLFHGGRDVSRQDLQSDWLAWNDDRGPGDSRNGLGTGDVSPRVPCTYPARGQSSEVILS